MKKFDEIFKDVNFEKKIINLKSNISNYLIKIEYDLKSLKIDDLFGYNNFDGVTKIYTSEKCPSDIKIIISDFIKNKFPN